ncbi:MAG TPA: peptidase M4 [Thermoanaerobaculia bacterium]|nr:peptidase M4 [Thermoanaerobaculia bacterium]
MAVRTRRSSQPTPQPILSVRTPPPKQPPSTAVPQQAGSSPVAQPTQPAPAHTAQATPAASPEEKPAYRALRVYAFDPSRGRRLGNHMTVRVKFEDLDKGLEGSQLHVIDFDTANNVYYKPADLNSRAALVEGGLAPSESDPRFHQQMAYAVAMETIRTFENALGRDIRFQFGDKVGPRSVLRIFPHAMYEPNAYYSRELGALLFGYFRASDEDAGPGLPGGTIFTCLSHDIVAHETTHAIVDTLRESFMEATNPDVLAFHEAFADIVALFQHFKFEEVVRDTLQRSGGVLHRFDLAPRSGVAGQRSDQPIFIIGEMPEGNPLLDLARQFGESMGRRAALRSALGVAPNPRALAEATEAHERGAVLVAAVFDAFFSSFMQRSADLIRLARAAAGGSDEIHPDIAARLAKEAAKSATHFCTMCIRALDYCPPVDITFGDFLRALITADTELYRSDQHEYRDALIQAFRARGIIPDDVTSLAEESLLWQKAPPETPPCPGLCFDLADPGRFIDENCEKLEQVVRAKPAYFGLCEDDTHTKATCNCKVPATPRAVRSVNMVVRGGTQRPQVEFIAYIAGHAPLEPGDDKKRFKGGATVVYDAAGTAKLVVYKNLSSKSRRKRQKEFLETTLAASPFTNYLTDYTPSLSLSAIHRGC